MAVKEFKVVEETKPEPKPNPIIKANRQVPHVTTGPLRDSDGYSVLKAAAYAIGAIPKDQAKEEIHVSEQLAKAYSGRGYTPHFGHRALLIPASTDLLYDKNPDGSDWGEMKSLKAELRDKMAATLPKQIDKDYVAKTMGTNSSTAGGTMVAPPSLGEVIDLQRNFEAFSRAGARNVTLPPNGRIIFPKQTSGATAYWVGEAASITESDLGTGQLSLEAKKLGCIVRANNELLRFATPDMEAMFRTDMAAQIGLKADSAMFDGTGGTQIKGLLTYSTATSWSQGTDAVLLHTASTLGNDGNTFQPQDVTKMTHKLPDPVQMMPKTWVFRTDHAQAIMSRRADAITTGDEKGTFVFSIVRDPNTGQPSGLYGSGLVTSYNVPGNRAKGSGTDLTCAILGAFGDWIVARSGVLEIEVNPYETNAFAQVQSLIRAVQYIDAGPRHLASFIYADTLLRTA